MDALRWVLRLALPYAVLFACLFTAGSTALLALVSARYTATAILTPNSDTIAVARNFGGEESLNAKNLGVGVPVRLSDFITFGASALEVVQSPNFCTRLLQDFPDTFQRLLAHSRSIIARGESGDGFGTTSPSGACERFDREVRHAYLDVQSGLVSISATWADPDDASEMSNLILAGVNLYVKRDYIDATDRRIAAIRQELATLSDPRARGVLAAALQAQLVRRSLLLGREEFAFRVIDPALPERAASKSVLAYAAYAFAGCGFGLLYGGVLGAIRACLVAANGP